MTTVSLNTIGSVLGKVGQVDLQDTVLNGYTRTHAVSGYRRINPFEVENGRAPPTFTAPHSLNEWENYQHTDINQGDDLLIAAGGYGGLDLTWTRPNGYTRDLANVTQKVYWKDMGLSQDLSVNPFSSPTGSADPGDGSSYSITGLVTDHWYAIGVKAEWDDSVATYENADSTAYDRDPAATPLIGGGRGISTDDPVFGTTPPFPNLTQNTDPDLCTVGDDVELKLEVGMEGPSTGRLEEEKNGGGFTLVDASVTAGTTNILLNRSSPDNWNFRIRYNDVGGGSPGPWSAEKNIDATCNLV